MAVLSNIGLRFALRSGVRHRDPSSIIERHKEVSATIGQSATDLLDGSPEKAIMKNGDWNPDGLTAGLDITGWASTDTGTWGGALITDRHVLFIHHWNPAGTQPPNGDTLRFHDPDGNPVERQVAGRQRVGESDLMIVLLDSDLPANIRRMPIASNAWYDRMGFSHENHDDMATVRVPILVRNRLGEAGVNMLRAPNPVAIMSRIDRWDASMPESGDTLHETYYLAFETGDSGQPVAFVTDSGPLLIGPVTFGGAGAGWRAGYYRGRIAEAIEAIDPGYGGPMPVYVDPPESLWASTRPTSGFDPLSLDPSLFLFADRLQLQDGDPVSVWSNEDGTAGDPANETASEQPTYESSPRPAVRFSRTNDRLVFGDITAEWLFLVLTIHSADAFGGIIGRASDYGFRIYFEDFKGPGNSGDAGDFPGDDGVVRINGVESLDHGGGRVLVAVKKGTTGDGVLDTIGEYFDGGDRSVDMSLEAALAYDGLTDGEAEDVEAWLAKELDVFEPVELPEYTYLNAKGEEIASELDTLMVQGSSAERNIYTLRDSDSGTYTRNENCWVAPIFADIACASPENTQDTYWRAGTLITPRHIILANHYPLSVGTFVVFANVSGGGYQASELQYVSQAGSSDLLIGRLADEIAVTPAVLAPDPATLLSALDNQIAGLPGMATNAQEEYAGAVEVDDIAGGEIIFRDPQESLRQPYHLAPVSGDSGNPVWIGAAEFLATVWKDNNPDKGDYIGSYLTEIQNAIDSTDSAAADGNTYTPTIWTP